MLDRNRVAHVVMTDRSHGDLAINSAGVEVRRQQIVAAPWSWLCQVHGNRVIEVTSEGSDTGQVGDALWTKTPGAVLSVQVADCAPIALIGSTGHIGIIHAGWRGLMAGVIESCVDEMTNSGAESVVAVLGACIHPEGYEFGLVDLEAVVERLGPSAKGCTSDGRPALDLPGAVKAALARQSIPLVHSVGSCTAANSRTRWSHRARGDSERQSMVVWMEQL